MDVKKIGGPDAPEALESPETTTRPGKGVQEAFDPHAEPASGIEQATDDLERIVLETVQAVRSGCLEPGDALEAVLDGVRESLAGSLPEAVEPEQVLEYIRETLEDDPAFLALLKGQ